MATCFTGTGFENRVLTRRERETCISPADITVPAFLGILGGVIMFIIGLRSVWKRRLIQNTPRSKTRSVAMGRVEVQGTIVPFKEITVAPFSGVQCVHFSYRLQKQTEYRDKNGSVRRSWSTIDSGRWSVPFFVEDETGRILIDPKGSETHTPPDHIDYPILPTEVPPYVAERLSSPPEGILRFTETILRPGDTVFVLGYAGDNPYVAETSADTAVADKMIQMRAGYPFFVSDRTEKEYSAELLALAQLFLVGGPILTIVCLIILMGISNIS